MQRGVDILNITSLTGSVVATYSYVAASSLAGDQVPTEVLNKSHKSLYWNYHLQRLLVRQVTLGALLVVAKTDLSGSTRYQSMRMRHEKSRPIHVPIYV